MPLTAEEIEREQKRITSEWAEIRRRESVARTLPPWERTRIEDARAELRVREALLEEEEEPTPEEDILIELKALQAKYQPSTEDLEKIERVAHRLKFRAQQHYRAFKPAVISRTESNDAKTVCLQREMKIILQERETGKRVESEKFMSPEACRTFAKPEMECIEKKADAPPCEQVAQAYACTNDMTIPQVAGVLNLDRSAVNRCVIELQKQGLLHKSAEQEYVTGVKTHDSVLGEPIYRMPRVYTPREGKKLVYDEATGRVLVRKE